MKIVAIDAKLKPLYANLKRLHIGEYLHTREFELFVLERDWDKTWAECRHIVEQNKTMFGVLSLDVEEREESLAYFLNLVFYIWHQKEPVAPNYFGSVLFPVLGRFVRWSKEQVNLARVYKCLIDLGVPSEQLERFSEETDRFQKARPANMAPQNVTLIQSHAITSKKVFIVHGHNKTVLLEVGEVLAKAGLKPIILHEQANSGQTIIEKFEKNADVGAAIVLLTADDVGRAKAGKKLIARARQNVVLELGYFVGKLGRGRVIPLYESGVELPSDFNGVVYEPLDEVGHWKFRVLKELQAMGYNVDANRIL